MSGFAERLKISITANHITLKKAAERLSVPDKVLRDWLNGASEPPVYWQEALLKRLLPPAKYVYVVYSHLSIEPHYPLNIVAVYESEKAAQKRVRELRAKDRELVAELMCDRSYYDYCVQPVL